MHHLHEFYIRKEIDLIHQACVLAGEAHKSAWKKIQSGKTEM